MPEGWSWTRLANVISLSSGKSIKVRQLTNDGTYPVYGGNGITGSFSEFNVESETIIIGRVGFYCGSIYKTSSKAWVTDNALICTIKFPEIYEIDFLAMALRYLKLGNTSVSTAQPVVSGKGILPLLVPVPPKMEQHRIKAAFCKVIPFVDTIERNKNSACELITKAKSEILDLAIRGKLVPQDPNDEPASVLLERIRAEKEELIKQGKIKRDKKESIIFRGDDNSYYEKIGDEVRCIDGEIPFDIPDNWEWIRLKNICNKIIDGSHNPPKSMDNITPFIMASSRNINFDTLLDLENVRYLCQCDYEIENERTNIKTGDILLTTVATLGRSCIYNGFPKNLCFQRSVTVISTDIVPEYLKLFLDAPYFQKFIFNNATGTAQKGFYLNQLENVLVCVPPLSEQTRMLQTADAILEQLIRIEKSLN